MKKNIKNYLSTGSIVVALVVALLLYSIPAHAIEISFGVGSSGGGGTITESLGIYTGTNIKFDTMMFYPNNHNSGPYSQYSLSGAGVGSIDGTALMNFVTGPGGYMQVVGGSSELGIPDGTVLVTGKFDTFYYNNSQQRYFGSGTDQKSSALLTELGVPVNTSWEFFNFEISADYTNVTSAHLQNLSVPEPATLLLLGAGLLGLGIFGRKKIKG